MFCRANAATIHDRCPTDAATVNDRANGGPLNGNRRASAEIGMATKERIDHYADTATQKRRFDRMNRNHRIKSFGGCFSR